MLLGPGVNIKRSPLCGRNFEYFSEDPHLAGVLGTAFVQGVQSQGVGTSLKHFAANNQETDRVRVSADVDERTLREIYLPAFERIVTEAQPWTVMCSYNRVNGTHASQHPWLLTEVLRDEWGFEGVVVSDWGAVHDRVAAVAAGLDLEMPPQLGWSDRALVEAVRAGDLDEAVLDVAVRPDARAGRPGPDRGPAGHRRRPRRPPRPGPRRRRARARCCSKNDGAAAARRRYAGGTVAVVGEFARTPRFQGAGSSQVNPTRVDVPLDELRAAVPDGVEVTFAAGLRAGGRRAATRRSSRTAVASAADADVVVVFLGPAGRPPSPRASTARHMDLPPQQLDLLRAVRRVDATASWWCWRTARRC